MTLEEFLEDWHSPSDTLLVHTSGSTGKPKPMWVEKSRMRESALLTCRFLGLDADCTALLCMPLDYIAAKMMVVRALVCGMRIIDVGVSGHPMASPLIDNEQIDFAAMVPLQVYNSLQTDRERERLTQVRHLLIGGGTIDERMEAQLATFPHAVWSSYGMTETLSHIALRKVNGADASQWYYPLEGVLLDVDEDNCLLIDAPRVCPAVLHTNDVVEYDRAKNAFKVLGRKDHVICSGGVKIQAEEVERMLGKYLDAPFFITSQKDEKFGEIVVLVTEYTDKKNLEDIFHNVLPKYWQPKKIVVVPELPRTETGKPKRTIL